MYFQELKRLREANPDLKDAVDHLDRYLASLTGSARNNITASTVAAALNVSRGQSIGLLMAAAELGLLKLKYRVVCPDGHGVRAFSRLQDIPTEVYCGACDQTYSVTTDDVEYFFELAEKAASVRG